jgi:hypothetical protein
MTKTQWILCVFLSLCACISADKPGTKTTRNVASESVAFKTEPLDWVGPYVVTKEALEKHYSNVELNRFGTFSAKMPMPNSDGRMSYLMRELHYRVYQTQFDQAQPPVQATFSKTPAKRNAYMGLGLRALPAVHGAYRDISLAEKENLGGQSSSVEVVGSQIVDEFLYKFNGYKDLKKDEPIFNILAYSHPENHNIDFFNAAKPETLKTENSITHMGAYIGKGQTRNSPKAYHSFSWESHGYPPILFAVQYAGADTRTFNQNAVIAMKILNEFNEGPKFPSDYKRDYFRASTLKDNLDYLRGWIDNDWIRPEDAAKGDNRPFFQKLNEDDTYKVYCAEHITITLNIALNVPQNLAGYQRVYGQKVGAQLWNKVVEKWKVRTRIRMNEASADQDKEFEPFEIDAATGLPKELTLVKKDSFIPLWQKEGISSSPVNGVYRSKDITVFGRSLAWKAETTADLLSDFVRQYGDFVEGNPVLTAALVVGFSKEAMGRTGIDFQKYFGYVTQILPSLFKHHAAYLLATKQVPGVTEEMVSGLYAQYQAGLKAILTKGIPEMADMITAAATVRKPQDLAEIQKMVEDFKKVPELNDLKTWVRQRYYQSVSNVMETAKREKVIEPDIEKQIEKGIVQIQYYSPPAVTYRIANGLHESHPLVQIAPIATVFEADELEIHSGSAPKFSVPFLGN